MGQFCQAQHQAWKDSPTEANHQGEAVFYLHAFLCEQKRLMCFCGEKWPQAKVHYKIVYICTQWHIEKAGIFASWTVIFLDLCFSSLALLKLLEVVIPCFVENVRTEQERQVVMCILETMNSVIKSCKEKVFINSTYLKEISHLIRDVLKKKVSKLVYTKVFSCKPVVSKILLRIRYSYLYAPDLIFFP